MKDTDSHNFELALDVLADMLRVNRLENQVKQGYFKALRRHSLVAVMDATNSLVSDYRPRHRNDFPVPATISEAITGLGVKEQRFWPCRCCKVEFPASNFHEMKCQCKPFEHCYHCDKCSQHCQCPKMTSLDQSEAWKKTFALDSPVVETFKGIVKAGKGKA